MEKTNSNSPVTNTVMVRLLAPFHSFKTIPQKLLNKMFNDIRMLHEKASITGASVPDTPEGGVQRSRDMPTRRLGRHQLNTTLLNRRR